MNKKDEAALKLTLLELAQRISIIEKALDKLTVDLENFTTYKQDNYKDRRRPGLV